MASSPRSPSRRAFRTRGETGVVVAKVSAKEGMVKSLEGWRCLDKAAVNGGEIGKTKGSGTAFDWALLNRLIGVRFRQKRATGLYQLIGRRTEGRGPWSAAQAMIQSVLEADELADQCVVAAVRTRAFGGELSVKINFSSVIERSTRGEKARAAEAWSCHPDKAGRDARTALLEILQALKDSIRTGQACKQFRRVRAHEGEV